VPYIKKRMAAHFLWAGQNRDFDILSQGYVRKMQCNYGWDWAPRLITCGIWKSIRLVAFSVARIDSVSIRQAHAKNAVRLSVDIDAQRVGAAVVSARARVSLDGEKIASATTGVLQAGATAELTVRAPRLWWPNGMGAQPLYDVTVELLDGAGHVLDTCSKRIGLRTLELVRTKDRWGESFYFSANGRPFFAKGANWVPAHSFLNKVTDATYRDLLQSARDTHMNMLRVWGGGFYESDTFYGLCDQLGICVWQDFMSACVHIPLDDQAFLDNYAIEAAQQVCRLRHHPSIALWCGNNEFEMNGIGDPGDPDRMHWDYYEAFFDRRLADIVAQHDPQRSYWPCSPHSPYGSRLDHNNPACGDAHLWYVWAFEESIPHYLTCKHRFVSEFGFQSFPEPRTIEAFTHPEDRGLYTPVMLQHQRSGNGNAKIMRHANEWFNVPQEFCKQVWLTQLLQALAIQTGVEHWRRCMPQTMGAMYWMINDCWPVVSWSSIDYYGRWKALHYAAKRFFAPVMVSGVVRDDGTSVEVAVCNDTFTPVKATLEWTVTDTAGTIIKQGRRAVTARDCAATRLPALDLSDCIRAHGAKRLVLWLDLRTGATSVACNSVALARPKDLALEAPSITAEVSAHDRRSFVVTLAAQRVALWAWLQLDGCDIRCSDNFMHLRPGVATRVDVTTSKPMTAAALRAALKVQSLWDLQPQKS
jgi:beta-mannosidase